MSFYYLREAGDEGQILSDEGDAPGIPLTELLSDGPLPIRPALELVAYVGDVLTIAEEDGVFHGDLKPGHLRLDSQGNVGVEGFGVERRGGRAPEGRPVGISTDTYGLGVILHAALTGEGLGAIPRDLEGHDDAIVDRLLQIDWQELNDRPWLDDVRSFLCSMLAHDPDERPLPLDVANLMGQVALQAGGDDLVIWAAQALSGDAAVSDDDDRRGGQLTAEDEELGGPEALSGPLPQGEGLKVRQAASAKGEATAFWSRDRIAALLAEEDDEDEPVRQAFVPGKGRVEREKSAPPPEQLDEPVAAPPPPRSEAPRGEPVAHNPPPPGPSPFAEGPRPGQPDTLLEPVPPPSAPKPAPPVAQGPTPPIVQGPTPTGTPAPPASPFAQGPRPGQPDTVLTPAVTPPPPPQAEKSGGGIALKLGVVVVLVGVLVCALGGGVAMVATWGASRTDGNVDVEEPDKPDVEDEEDTGAAGGEGGDAEDAEEGSAEPSGSGSGGSSKGSSSGSSSSGSSSSGSSKGSSSGSSSSGSSTSGSSKGSSSGSSSSGSSSSGSSKGSSSGSSSSGSSSSGASSGTPAAGSPRTVKITVAGSEALLQCGDGQQVEFVGSTRLTFTDVTTCRVKVGASMGVITVTGDGSFNCVESAGKVNCTGG